MIKRLLVAIVALVAFGGISTPVMAHGKGETVKVVLHVDENNKKKMNIVLNNAKNINKYYKSAGKEVEIEIVAYGPGLNMLRDDKSPVKSRIIGIGEGFSNIKFAACGNTIKGVTKKEGKKPVLIDSDSIRVVPSGVIQIIKRQDQGWHYIRP